MTNVKWQGILLILLGFLLIGSGLYIYFVAHTIYPDSDSSRVQNLNWLLKNIGKEGVIILLSSIGVFFVFLGIRKLK